MVRPLFFAALLLVSGCGYHCRWHSHGACVATEGTIRIMADAGGPEWTDEQWQAVLDETIANATSYWNHGGIGGWTIVLSNDAPSCYLLFIGQGCTYPLPFEDNVIHVEAPPDCPTEYVPHEIGHAVLPGHDPFHWAGGWETLDRQPKKVARCAP